jgi:hypothetical protein
MLPKFGVTSEGNDVTTSVRITKIQNGFILRTGGKPIHYPEIGALADAVREGIMAIDWEEAKDERSDRKPKK